MRFLLSSTPMMGVEMSRNRISTILLAPFNPHWEQGGGVDIKRNSSSSHFNNRLFKLLLYLNLVNPSLEILLEVKFSLKIIIVMIFWMSVVTGIIFGINSLIKLPDEITGPAFFLGIGMAISSTINYYK